MLFKIISFSALSAIALLTQTSTQSSAHQRRGRVYPLDNHRLAVNQRRDTTRPEVVQLQSQYSLFKGWMDTFFATANTQDQAVAVLKSQFTAYDGWITNFFSEAGIANAATASNATIPPLSSPAAVYTPTTAAAGTVAAVTAASTRSVISPSMANVTAPASALATAPSRTGVAHAVQTFNAKSSTNQVVYYGQTPATQQVKLARICADPSVDIVILAFLTTYFGPDGYPVLNLGAACGSDATKEAQAKGAAGILDCPEVAGDIEKCQAAGKKVMLSLGGSDGTTTFASERQAVAFATTVWNIFGGGTSDVGRPFGSVTLDGFDIGKCTWHRLMLVLNVISSC